MPSSLPQTRDSLIRIEKNCKQTHSTKRHSCAVGLYRIVMVLILCLVALNWPPETSEASRQLFHAPIEIESVFPVSGIRESELTELEQNSDGYEIWGKEIVSQSHIPVHFSTGVSYPWEYNKENADRLAYRLQQLPSVRSAKVESFPSIHPQTLKTYPDYQPLTKQERIIRITLRDWPHAQLLSFPTFVVLLFKYQDPRISYSDIVKDWKKTVVEFHELHELRMLLGIEPRLQWQTIPYLSWVNLPYYMQPDFWNRYWSGTDRDEVERNKQFLQENSLTSFGVPDPGHRVIHCNHISYESSMPGTPISYRYFYAAGDWFNGSDTTIYVSSTAANMMWIRVVRAALLVNVVLPAMEKRSSDLVDKLAHVRSRLVNARTSAFREFSLAALDPLHNEVSHVENELRSTKGRQERIKEALAGHEALLAFLSNPYRGPLTEAIDKPKSSNGQKGWNCTEEYFDFEQDNRLLLNDRKKANNYVQQIRKNLDRLDDASNALKYELSDALSLLEGRRSILWSKQNTWLAIFCPAAGAVLFGILYFGAMYMPGLWRVTEKGRTILPVLIPAIGALVGSVIWWIIAF